MASNTDKKVIKSHIQMPKFMLRRFESPSSELWCYDVKQNKSGIKGYAKSINREAGYYSEGIEKYLHDHVEDPFSRFLQKMGDIDFSVEIMDKFSTDEETVNTFILSLMMRSPNFIADMDKHSFVWSLLKEQEKHDYAVKQGLEFAKSMKFLDDFYLSFIHNMTSYPFVLPTCGVYSFRLKNIRHIILPVSPQMAVALLGNEALLESESKKTMYYIDDEKAVKYLNFQAFSAQCHEGNGRVVSSEKNVLDILAMNNKV